MVSMRHPVTITLHFRETAKSAEEWCEFHHDTYGFVMVSCEGMTCTVVPDLLTTTEELCRMFTEDHVHHALLVALPQLRQRSEPHSHPLPLRGGLASLSGRRGAVLSPGVG